MHEKLGIGAWKQIENFGRILRCVICHQGNPSLSKLLIYSKLSMRTDELLSITLLSYSNEKIKAGIIITVTAEHTITHYLYQKISVCAGLVLYSLNLIDKQTETHKSPNEKSTCSRPEPDFLFPDLVIFLTWS